MYLVSACLLGLRTPYNGKSKDPPGVPSIHLQELIPVCPEQLGGLPTPRPPAELRGGEGKDVLAGKAFVFNCHGDNVTRAFLRGACETLYLALLYQVEGIILKDGSPSCGSSYIYDGTFSGCRRAGDGVTTALLREYGLVIFNENKLFEGV